MLHGSDKKLVVQVLLDAYRQGAFPMADPDTGAVNFYTTDWRGVFPLEPGAFRVSRSLRRRIRSGWFEVTTDTAFADVVDRCAEPRPKEPDTWIDACLKGWYAALFEAGHAHSVEVRRTDPATGERRMVGGIFGVCLGGAFFGESMFSRPKPRQEDGSRHPFDGTDASKIALTALVHHLRRRRFKLFDTQFTNPHLETLGCVEISNDAYMRRLAPALRRSPTWGELNWPPQSF